MATLLLTAVGTLAGGPLGGALGALAGRQIDGVLFGAAGNRQGPRLKELSVTTSSYGQPIARHFGQVRVAGTIIWATDLHESKERSGGGKGKPKITTYSYSISFAVAVSSLPIRSIGRIWADGKLLRGAAGDLKVPGSIRVHLGHGDQKPDPLIASAIGAECPGFRDCAYVVFDDLALGEFGNRIPAITFEVFGLEAAPVRLSHLAPFATVADGLDALPQLLGFTDEGGSLSSSLELIDAAFPLSSTVTETGLVLALIDDGNAPLPSLPSELMRHDGDRIAPLGGSERSRSSRSGSPARALRYYDLDRDFQIGLQLAPGSAAGGEARIVDLPAVLNADDARTLSLEIAQSERWQGEKRAWRIAELDTSIQPGTIVLIPGENGKWLISSWEWFDGGVELELERLRPTFVTTASGAVGQPALPLDLPASASQLRVFELPPDGSIGADTASYSAAACSNGSGWQGASLFVEQGNALVPLGTSVREQTTIGVLAAALAPSNAVVMERDVAIEVDVLGSVTNFANASIAAIAAGANRLMVGGEAIQYTLAEQTGQNRWRLSGLLRGRGGTEHLAASVHQAGTPVIAIEDTLVTLDPELVTNGGPTRFAAIGLGDSEPVYAELLSSGVSRRPPAPVHVRYSETDGDTFQINWTRRARGQWRWMDHVDAPLIEESERYEVGAGAVTAPLALWQSDSSQISIENSALTSLYSLHGEYALWVRQIGTFGVSPATFIKQINGN